MSEKVYFYLLILCGILSRGIIKVFADEEIKESSDFLVREKRVVSLLPGEDNPISIKDAPYTVLIKHCMRKICTGNILSNFVVITAASCVPNLPNQYQLIFGRTASDHSASIRDIIDIRKHFRVALLVIDYPFEYNDYCQPIGLHVGPLLPGIVATIRGWGFNWRCEERGTNHPTKLRSIDVPIMAHRDCVNRYGPRIMISDKEVCTFHAQRHCGHIDFGAGLIVDGRLAGIHIFTGMDEVKINPFYPDVFAILQHSDYNQWIRLNLQNISAHFQHHQHP